MMKRSKTIEERSNRAIAEKSRLLKEIEQADTLKIQPLIYPKQRLLWARDLSLYYSGRKVVNNVGFSLARGERLALMGKNGCGKSTLLKAVLGQEIERRGELCIGGGVTVSYVPQDASALAGDLFSFAQKGGLDISLFFTVLRKLGFERCQLETPLQNLSGGQKKKVLIAKSLCTPAHLYVWDEPLNYIDILSRMQLEQLLLQAQPTMVFVEHDRAFLDAVATKILAL